MTYASLPGPEPTGYVAKMFKNNRWSIWSMDEGLEQIVIRLRDRLGKEDRTHLYNNKPCTYIEFGDSKTKVSICFIFPKILSRQPNERGCRIEIHFMITLGCRQKGSWKTFIFFNGGLLRHASERFLKHISLMYFFKP